RQDVDGVRVGAGDEGRCGAQRDDHAQDRAAGDQRGPPADRAATTASPMAHELVQDRLRRRERAAHSIITRGSRAACTTSVARFTSTTQMAKTRATPWMTG